MLGHIVTDDLAPLGHEQRYRGLVLPTLLTNERVDGITDGRGISVVRV
jgi:hypothetical protein